MKRIRCLDAGCGDGRVTKELLLKHFKKVDMFDRCGVAVKALKELRKTYK